MIVLFSLVGILSLLLVVTAYVAYLALPRGRLCPQCGGATNPVVLRRLLRVLSRWIQWRWCSRCGWEGAGRRGTDLGPPADPGSGFHWGEPDDEEVPIFYWRSDRRDESGAAAPTQWPWFERRADEERMEPADPAPRGFRLSPSGEMMPPPLPLGQGRSIEPEPGVKRRYQAPRPWYLSWLVSKRPSGFQWKERGD